jgi:hypothetical protein
MASKEKDNNAKDYYDEYAASRNTIRVWFVTFGIGGLYLLLTQQETLKKLNEFNLAKEVSVCFLIGVGAQLFIALLNKYLNWYNYYCENHGKAQRDFLMYLSRQFWIDILCDIISCYSFGQVIWLLINVYST